MIIFNILIRLQELLGSFGILHLKEVYILSFLTILNIEVSFLGFYFYISVSIFILSLNSEIFLYIYIYIYIYIYKVSGFTHNKRREKLYYYSGYFTLNNGL